MSFRKTDVDDEQEYVETVINIQEVQNLYKQHELEVGTSRNLALALQGPLVREYIDLNTMLVHACLTKDSEVSDILLIYLLNMFKFPNINYSLVLFLYEKVLLLLT
jgi:hypothetical protein